MYTLLIIYMAFKSNYVTTMETIKFESKKNCTEASEVIKKDNNAIQAYCFQTEYE